MSPFDTVSVRLYNQPAAAEGAAAYYTGFFDCIRKTYASEGVLGFYKGYVKTGAQQSASSRLGRFFPVWLRIAPHTVITFIVWEKLLAWEAAR